MYYCLLSYSLRVIHLLLGLVLGVNAVLTVLSLELPDTCGRGPGSGDSSADIQLGVWIACMDVDSSVRSSSIL